MSFDDPPPPRPADACPWRATHEYQEGVEGCLHCYAPEPKAEELKVEATGGETAQAQPAWWFTLAGIAKPP